MSLLSSFACALLAMTMEALGGTNIWKISGEERSQHDAQFFQLKPVNGFIDGGQARPFFVQSGLPSQTLAQIWGLADLNHDGKMDKKEFSIAMHLIKIKLKGFTIPETLPDSLKADPEPPPMTGQYGPSPPVMTASPVRMPPGNLQQPVFIRPGMQPMMVPGQMMVSGAQPVPVMIPPGGAQPMPMMMPLGSSPIRQPAAPTQQARPIDWSMPQATKLKYHQQFNNIDKQRVGSLTGAHARNILGSSGLPPALLAQVWNLSDLDKDGRLTVDEFAIAMHLIELLKSGVATALPPTTPPELVPHVRPRTTSIGGDSGAQTPFEAANADVAAASGALSPQSFEARRQSNFDKGQAELERRRAILQEEENRQRAERERKEREEFDRRERERLEIERRRALEREKEMARIREIEQQKAEEYRKMMEQREAARRELDRHKQVEWEKQRLQELAAARQREQEGVCHLKQAEKNVQFRLQAMNEKSGEVNAQITEMRARIVGVTSSIEGMKGERDRKVADIQELQRAVQEVRMRAMQVAQQRAALTDRQRVVGGENPVGESLRVVMHTYRNKEMNMEALRATLTELERDAREKKTSAEERQSQLAEGRVEFERMQKEHAALEARVVAKQEEVRALIEERKRAVHAAAKPVNGFSVAAFPTTAGSGFDDDNWAAASAVPAEGARATIDASGHSIVRYRALYEFVARADDELSFGPGDVIQVYQDYPAQEGWLAGQIRGKVGWFPKDYADPLGEGATADTGVDDAAWQPARALDGISEEPPAAVETSPGIAKASSYPEGDLAGVGTGGPRARMTTSGSEQPIAGAPLPAGAVRAQALYPFKAKKETQLTFNKGDVIAIIEQQEMFWHGELVESGKRGWFPKSYVRVVAAAAVAASQSAEKIAPDAGGTLPEGDLVEAIYPFVAGEPGDLPFKAGDRIVVTKKDGDWWSGRLADGTGEEGIFPANYVQPIGAAAAVEPAVAPASESRRSSLAPVAPAPAPPPEVVVLEVAQVIAPFEATQPTQLSLQPGDMVRVHTKSPSGWWEGELQRKGQEKLFGWFPGNYVKALATGSRSGSVSSVGGVSAAEETKGRTASVSSSASAAATSGVFLAVYDYAAQHDDELSFSAGDVIEITTKVDADWWRGTIVTAGNGVGEGQSGLLPSNYVQQKAAIQGQSASEKKRLHALHELIQTEANYADDMCVVTETFFRPLHASGTLTIDEYARLAVNWADLIKISRKFAKTLQSARLLSSTDSSGTLATIVLKQIDSFRAFVTFCSNQQAALDLLELKEKRDAAFRAAYTRCVQSAAARSLPLSVHLLLPLNRVTKYPLMVQQVAKYTTDAVQATALTRAGEALRELCAEVDRVATEVDNFAMLAWCQEHVRCDALRPKLVFPSETNNIGPRRFLHSGTLYKAKSSRLLVALLFNDLLMLTTPDTAIDSPESFKLQRISECTLTLYKMPLVLARCSVSGALSAGAVVDPASVADCLFSLTCDELVLNFRAASSNSRIFWVNQLEKAIQRASGGREVPRRSTPGGTVARPPSSHALSSSPIPRGSIGGAAPIGRLLVELVVVRQLSIPDALRALPVYAEMSVGEQQRFRAPLSGDLAKQQELALSTQFLIEREEETAPVALRVAFFVERAYAPDVCAGRADIGVRELLKETVFQRSPVNKQVPLEQSDFAPSADAGAAYAIVKLFVQLFPS